MTTINGRGVWPGQRSGRRGWPSTGMVSLSQAVVCSLRLKVPFLWWKIANSGGKTLGDRLQEKSVYSVEVLDQRPCISIECTASGLLDCKGNNTSRQMRCGESSTSSLYGDVIKQTQVGRCTRCWIWRQLSNPTGLWRLPWSSWRKYVHTTGLSPVRHVFLGFSLKCKHWALERKKNVLILEEWQSVAAQ